MQVGFGILGTGIIVARLKHVGTLAHPSVVLHNPSRQPRMLSGPAAFLGLMLEKTLSAVSWSALLVSVRSCLCAALLSVTSNCEKKVLRLCSREGSL